MTQNMDLVRIARIRQQQPKACSALLHQLAKKRAEDVAAELGVSVRTLYRLRSIALEADSE